MKRSFFLYYLVAITICYISLHWRETLGRRNTAYCFFRFHSQRQASGMKKWYTLLILNLVSVHKIYIIPKRNRWIQFASSIMYDDFDFQILFIWNGASDQGIWSSDYICITLKSGLWIQFPAIILSRLLQIFCTSMESIVWPSVHITVKQDLGFNSRPYITYCLSGIHCLTMWYKLNACLCILFMAVTQIPWIELKIEFKIIAINVLCLYIPFARITFRLNALPHINELLVW